MNRGITGLPGQTSLRAFIWRSFPSPIRAWDDSERTTRWNELLALREQVLIALEGLRKTKQIGSAQEARVRITTNRPERLLPERELLSTLCIVSEVEIVADPAAAAESVIAERSPLLQVRAMLELSAPPSGRAPLHPTFCERCVRVVTALHSV